MKTPLKYQLRGLAKMNRLNGRVIVAQDMGLGKTFQTAMWLNMQMDDGLPVIVVCPSIVKWQWEAEMRTELGLKCFVACGQKPPRPLSKRQEILNHDCIIINYEILKLWVPLLLKYKAETVVLDEGHRVKNIESKTFKHCQRLMLKQNKYDKEEWKPRTRYGIILTGTPLTNYPIELWAVAHLARPDLFPSRTKYAWRYCSPKRTPFGWNLNGSARRSELHQILRKEVMLRQTKKKCLKDLPGKQRFVVPLDVADYSTYLEAETDIVKFIAKTDPQKAAKAKKAKALIRIGQLKKLAAELKLNQVVDWIDCHFETGKKLVVFGHHIELLETLRDRLQKYKPVLVNGNVSEKSRRVLIKKFCSQDSCRLFIANMKSAGTGVNGLQRVCDTMAVVEMGFNPAEHNQAEARLDRLEQKNPVSIHYLIARNTIEEDLCRLIYAKQQILDEVVDGSKSADGDFSIFEQLAAACLSRRKERNGNASKK